MDAVLLNLGVHSYVLDPHVRQRPSPLAFFALPIPSCAQVYGRMVELILPVVELAGGGGGVLWYVTNAHVAGGKHPHNQKRYMHELQNDVRFGEPSSLPAVRAFCTGILQPTACASVCTGLGEDGWWAWCR